MNITNTSGYMTRCANANVTDATPIPVAFQDGDLCPDWWSIDETRGPDGTWKITRITASGALRYADGGSLSLTTVAWEGPYAPKPPESVTAEVAQVIARAWPEAVDEHAQTLALIDALKTKLDERDRQMEVLDNRSDPRGHLCDHALLVMRALEDIIDDLRCEVDIRWGGAESK